MIEIFTYADSAESAFALDPTYQAWFQWRVSMMTGYTPWLDPALKFHRRVGAYLDAYAGYNNATLSPGGENAPIQPNWILTDANGVRLSIPYGFANGAWPEYALNIKDPAVVAYICGRAQARKKLGYTVLLVDDMNLALRLTKSTDPTGALVPPPNNDACGFAEAMVELAEAIRAAVPGMAIIHNPIWFADARQDLIDRQIRACDFVNCERGFGDPGLNPQTYEQFMSYIDHVHALGRPVLQDEADKTNLSFRVACFLLMWQPGDLFNAQTLYPNAWDPSLDIDFGSPLGPRQRQIAADGSLCYTRDFTKVSVAVNFTTRVGTVTAK